MSIYQEYLKEIEERKTQGLNPKPIDGGDLIKEVITLVKNESAEGREEALKFFI
jgi:aconitate hydratase 2/2-methylisocitrate dehydratase